MELQRVICCIRNLGRKKVPTFAQNYCFGSSKLKSLKHINKKSLCVIFNLFASVLILCYIDECPNSFYNNIFVPKDQTQQLQYKTEGSVKILSLVKNGLHKSVDLILVIFFFGPKRYYWPMRPLSSWSWSKQLSIEPGQSGMTPNQEDNSDFGFDKKYLPQIKLFSI